MITSISQVLWSRDIPVAKSTPWVVKKWPNQVLLRYMRRGQYTSATYALYVEQHVREKRLHLLLKPKICYERNFSKIFLALYYIFLSFHSFVSYIICILPSYLIDCVEINLISYLCIFHLFTFYHSLSISHPRKRRYVCIHQ